MAGDYGEDTHRRMSRHMSKDEGRLAELGYKQELRRDWSLMHNFGVSFSIIVCDHDLASQFRRPLTY